MTPSPTNIPHRKNAAEWAMWILLQPVRWFLLCRARATAARTHREGGSDGHG